MLTEDNKIEPIKQKLDEKIKLLNNEKEKALEIFKTYEIPKSLQKIILKIVSQ